MQNASNLRVHDKARKVAVLTYQLTRCFPAAERFGITSQMRRAAISIGANIAEGCGRQGNRALLSFLHIAMGSASELEFQLLVAIDVGLCSSSEAAALAMAIDEIKRMTSRLIVRLRCRDDLPP